MSTLAVVGYYEAWWIQILKAIIIFAVGLQLVPVVLIAERKLLGPLPGPLRPQPRRPLRRAAAARRHPQAADQGAVPARPPRSACCSRSRRLISILTAVAAFAIIPFGNVQNIFGTPVGLYGIDVSIGPLYVFAFGGDRLLRDHARRLVLGLEVLVPRRDARRRAADLLRGLPGPRAGRRDHHRADALADRDRRSPERHVVHHAAVLRLPDLPRSRASPRPTARRST